MHESSETSRGRTGGGGLVVEHPEWDAVDPRAEGLVSGIGGFPASDRGLFLAGYSELCGACREGGHVLEICGGFGKLAAALAGAFPDTKVTGLDLYVPKEPGVEENLRRCPNLEYVAGDAFDLSGFGEGSLDLVWGQAALHHLSHDLDGLCREVARVLRPGGKLVFIFEPLGHNYAVAAIRAVRMARHELGDESNLYFSQFRRMAGYFESARVQSFNLLGYPMKAFSDRFGGVSRLVRRADARLFRMCPLLMRYGANCNLVFSKGGGGEGKEGRA